MSRKNCALHNEDSFDRYEMARSLRTFAKKTPDDKMICTGDDTYLSSKLACAAAWMDENNQYYSLLIKYTYTTTKTKTPMGKLRAMILAAADALERPLGGM